MPQKTIGQIIAQQRKEKNMTQRKLAEKLNVSPKTISRWETEIYMPDLSLLTTIAELLDISVFYLLTGEKPEKQNQKNNNLESEVRYYYSLSEEEKIINYLKNFEALSYKGKFYEKTIQYDHPCQEYSFYSKEIDARFRIRQTKNNEYEKNIISYKRRLGTVSKDEIGCEEEIELTIQNHEYNNLIYLLENVLKLKLIESYERNRYIFSNSDVEIDVDIYPFIIALEIENKSFDKDPKTIILYYLNKLNLKLEDSYKLSWDDKYTELCTKQNIPKYNIVNFRKKMPTYENHYFNTKNDDLN